MGNETEHMGNETENMCNIERNTMRSGETVSIRWCILYVHENRTNVVWCVWTARKDAYMEYIHQKLFLIYTTVCMVFTTSIIAWELYI